MLVCYVFNLLDNNLLGSVLIPFDIPKQAKYSKDDKCCQNKQNADSKCIALNIAKNQISNQFYLD